ncbi:MAG TPA: ABC transporter permease [Thermotogota bacterium]|nr:ABC transporter permease [Thermotogota bacterium]
MERRSGSFSVVWRRIRKNRMAAIGAFIVLFVVGVALLAPWISPYRPEATDLMASLEGPSKAHWFGTDIYGRDILSRIIWGARVSFSISFLAVLLSSILGVLLGAIAAFFGKVFDEIIMRTFDILLSFPDILLAIAIMAILGPGQNNLVFAITIYSLPQFARIARGAVLGEKNREYVDAARLSGESEFSILVRYVLPNTLSPIIVQATLRVAYAILIISGLGFLGLGIQPPTPEWGTDLSVARNYLRVAPHTGIFPGIAIFLTVMGFNFFGDGLNEALNPRMKDR